MKYTNPIIRGFHPDPSICRVGEDYYLVTSTFEYFPGIPVYHSRDLVNWELIGHCIDRAEQLPMDAVKPSSGIWAPTIRYNNGTFYVTATFNEKENFIVHSKEPARGYSNAVWTQMDGIDPSMYFEDGEMYYIANNCGSRYVSGIEKISMAKMDPFSGKLMGEIQTIWQGTGGGWLEGPHLYHVGEYYYLLAAEGGSGWGHMVTQARSKSIWGPYESCPCNPILTNRNDTTQEVLETGHADLVGDGKENYFMVHLGIRPSNGSKTHLGRETFLMPVKLEKGWFLVEGGKSVLKAEIFGEGVQKALRAVTADFTRIEWEKEWIFIGSPKKENYLRGGGELILKPSASTFVAMRQPDFACQVQADISLEDSGVAAGLSVYLEPAFQYRFYKSCEKQGTFVVLEKYAEDLHEVTYRERVPDGTVRLTVKAEKIKYYFSYSVENHSFDAGTGSTRFLCTAITNRCFTGTVIGLFAEGEESGRAYVKRFELFPD